VGLHHRRTLSVRRIWFPASTTSASWWPTNKFAIAGADNYELASNHHGQRPLLPGRGQRTNNAVSHLHDVRSDNTAALDEQLWDMYGAAASR